MIRFVFLSVWLVSFYCLYIGCLFDQLSVWLVGLLLPRRSSRENICAGEWPAVQAKFIADIPLARRTTTIPHHQIPKCTASPPWRTFWMAQIFFFTCHKSYTHPVYTGIQISIYNPSNPYLLILWSSRVAEVAREHGWHPPKSLDSDENFKPEHTLFCRKLRFVAIYALFLEIIGHKKCLFG